MELCPFLLQKRGINGAKRSDLHRVEIYGGLFFDSGDSLTDPIQGNFYVIIKDIAISGQFDISSLLLEQRDAEFLFHAEDCFCESRLCDVKSFGGPRKMLIFCSL